jgi:hypothetical protein
LLLNLNQLHRRLHLLPLPRQPGAPPPCSTRRAPRSPLPLAEVVEQQKREQLQRNR